MDERSTSEDLSKEENVNSLVNGARTVPVWVNFEGLCVVLWCWRLVAVDFLIKVTLQTPGGVVLGMRGGRGGQQTTSNE